MIGKLALKQIFIISISVIVTAAIALAQTTAFNFQGRLNDGANPANGNFEMQFKLYDALAGGNQIGATVSRPNVAVINGIFSTPLDFGAAAFDGSNRFVEIGVRPAGGTGGLTTLNPRQAILSTPYSIQAKNAAQLGGIDASQYVTTTTVGNSFIRNATTQQTGNFNISGNGFVGGNLGIGTTAPISKLAVQTATGNYGFTQTDGTITVGSYVGGSQPGVNGGWLGTRSNSKLFFFTNDGNPQMTVDTTGNVGIGITNPTARLQILSSVAGTSGIYSESPSGRAIWGKSVTSRGVYGESTSLEGVFGVSSSGSGVSGNSTSGIGVYGETFAASLTTAGVFGNGRGNDSIGVVGEANLGSGVGVFGVSTSPTGFGMYARNNSGGRAIYAQGNVAQSLDSNGLVKAMIVVKLFTTGPNIERCYNGVTNSSTGNCGFTVTQPLSGVFRIDYGFPVANRFVSVSCRYDNGSFSPHRPNSGANYRVFGTTSIEIFTFLVNNAEDTFPIDEFTVIIF